MCALESTGDVLCLGTNVNGQIGDGTINTALTPTAPTGLGLTTWLSAGDQRACAVTDQSAVECWGDNNLGELGVGTSGNYSSRPVAVTGLPGAITAVSAGGFVTCALGTGGAVTCWGDNSAGEIGTGATTPTLVPMAGDPVAGITTAIAISAGREGGNFVCALLADGTVKCWGDNSRGQLGNGSTTGSPTPVAVTGLTGVTAIAAGDYFTCALLSGGAVKCWGDNSKAQLGDGTTTDATTPVSVIVPSP